LIRALLDTNVVLDVLLNREPFVAPATRLWELNEQRKYRGYISAMTPVNVFYIGRKLISREKAHQAVAELLSTFSICSVDAAVLQNAVNSPLTDYEDAVQYECAIAAGLDAIITRNIKDFNTATLPIFTPDDFLKQFTEGQK
jgi:predicted nucleic acid-binding protein